MPTKVKVLIVDDEERFRVTLRKLLVANGLEATGVASGKEAIEALKQHSYDVILLDVKMPEMDGVAALEEFKKIDWGVEVIILTGHTSVDVVEEMRRVMRYGVFDYVMKPADLDELLLRIRQAYERKSLHEQKIREKPVR